MLGLLVLLLSPLYRERAGNLEPKSKFRMLFSDVLFVMQYVILESKKFEAEKENYKDKVIMVCRPQLSPTTQSTQLGFHFFVAYSRVHS